MSQRDSGYERKERDLYETPEWVTEALLPHLPAVGVVWEPAAATGKMVRVLQAAGMRVFASDIDQGYDFLTMDEMPIASERDAIITNPPYELAADFIVRSVLMTKRTLGLVAMLLRTDFDHAKTRSHLFQSALFAKKIVLTRRIRWFEDSKGSPSFNHAWFIWDHRHQGAPTLAYGP